MALERAFLDLTWICTFDWNGVGIKADICSTEQRSCRKICIGAIISALIHISGWKTWNWTMGGAHESRRLGDNPVAIQENQRKQYYYFVWLLYEDRFQKSTLLGTKFFCVKFSGCHWRLIEVICSGYARSLCLSWEWSKHLPYITPKRKNVIITRAQNFLVCSDN